MKRVELTETMRAEMKPDVYGGPTCDQVEPRWWCYGHGDKEGDFQHELLILDARLFPPGTKISIKEPVCPKCEETRWPITPTPETGPAFDAKCQCGFDWDEWVGIEYS